jgi:parvulin-like peptidyl-prolyl isomerase
LRSLARRVLRAPLLHFALLGGAAFALEPIVAGEGNALRIERAPIQLAAAKRAELIRSYSAETGRAPDEPTIAALVEEALDDEVLFREARARGLHEIDSVVRQRLVQNMRFLEGETQKSDDELFAESLKLEMDASDVVVRRRLIQLLELAAFSSARLVEPSDADLAAYLEAHRERFLQPERVSATQIFLSRDQRAEALERDARALLAQLERDSIAPENSGSFGDPFLLPRELPLRSETELARSFGAEFASALLRAPLGRWSGPIRSAYGMHAVFVHERSEARMPELSVVRTALREGVFEERGSAAREALVRELRAQWGVPRAEAPAS